MNASRSRLASRLGLAVAGGFLVLLAAWDSASFLRANPAGADVRHGEIGFVNGESLLEIHQSTSRGIIEWDSFSIGLGETTRFIQPGANSVTLNRVTSNSVSRIDGTLSANGRVFLLNPNGVMIGSDGVVDTAGFTASTLDLSDDAFLAGGDLAFEGDTSASIVNLGSISASEGDVFLVAATVVNEGSIEAPNGTVGLAAGNDVLIAESGNERVFVRGASGPEDNSRDGAINRGTIDANVAELKSYGGNIYGMAVQNEGRVAATGVTRQGGQLFLSAGAGVPGGGGRVQSTGQLVATPVASPEESPDPPARSRIEVDAGETGTAEIGSAENGGTVDASSNESGGTILIFGETIDIFANSLVIADGENGGGQVLIGGVLGGNELDFTEAVDTTVGSGTAILADAGASGDGGEIIVFASRNLGFDGFASVRGGDSSGNGGHVELSGQRNLTIGPITDLVDLEAPNGRNGHLTLDPEWFDILPDSGGTEPVTNTLYADDLSSFLQTRGSLDILTSVETESGSGNITFHDGVAIDWNTDAVFRAWAAGDLVVEDGVSITSGWSGGGVDIPGGDVVLQADRGVSIGEASGTSPVIQTDAGEISVSSGEEMDALGVGLYGATLQTQSGAIGIKGVSHAAASAGLSITDSRIRSMSGDINLSGENGDVDGSGNGIEIGVSVPGTTETRIETGVPGEVALWGRSAGEGYAIFAENAAPPSGALFQAYDDSVPAMNDPLPQLKVKSGGGSVSIFDLDVADLFFSLEDGASGDATFRGEIDYFASPSAQDVRVENAFRELEFGPIQSTGTIEGYVEYGDLHVSGPIQADGVSLEAGYYDQTFRIDQIPNANWIDVSGADLVETQGTVDLNVFDFEMVGEVRGVGENDRLIGPDADSDVFVDSVPVGGAGSLSIPGWEGGESAGYETNPTYETRVMIEPVSEGEETSSISPGFFSFDDVGGGAGNDDFHFDLEVGEFAGMRFHGGVGNDSFRMNSEAGYGSIDGGADFDFLDFGNLKDPVTVDFGNRTASWLDDGSIAEISAMESVQGSSSTDDVLRGTENADRFRIESDNGGFLNNGQFSGFEYLDGRGGADRFTFRNQASVAGGVRGGLGFDSLVIDDRGLSGENLYTISDNTISRNPTYMFTELELLQLLLGPGNDTIATTGNGLIQLLNGGPGFDTLNFGGASVAGQNPFTVGGSTIIASGFESPAAVANTGNEGDEILTQQTMNVPGNDPNQNSQGAAINQFSNNGNNSPTPQNLGIGGNAFAATNAAASQLAQQAAVIQIDGGQYLLGAPASLNGQFTLPPLPVIELLEGNLQPEAWKELADAIDFDGGTILVMGDGPNPIDLAGVPPAEILPLLQQNLSTEGTRELYAALELTLVLPITSQDGPVGIVAVPVPLDPEVVNQLAQLLGDDAYGELAAALDGE